jgi:membrane protease YdiL (CAAX protease family)
MHGLVAAVSALLFVYLCVGAGFVGRARLERLRAALAGADPHARRQAYLTTMARSWALAALALLLLAGTGFKTHHFPILEPGYAAFFVVVIGAGIALGAVRIKRFAATPEGREQLVNKLGEAALVLPETEGDRRLWVFVSLTAGITEELLYRGFLLLALLNAFHFTSFWPFAIVSAVGFGAAHIYQGARKAVLVGILGGVFVVVTLSAGLIVAMALHALIDLRILLFPGDVVADATQRVLAAARDK